MTFRLPLLSLALCASFSIAHAQDAKAPYKVTDGYKVATPANWKDGEDVIVAPALSDEEATEKFPKGFTTLKPYLRVTPQPNK